MKLVPFLVLLTLLLTSIFWIIPTYAPADKADMIKNLVGLAFPIIILGVGLYDSRLRDKALIVPIVFYGLVAALCVSGTFWWIPTYVSADKQHTATTWLYASATVAIIVSQMNVPSLKITL